MTDLPGIRELLQEAWERWLRVSGYAQEHRNKQFFKKFCKYVVLMWNKADADAQFLRQMFVGSVGFSASITPMTDPRVQQWCVHFRDDVQHVLLVSDLQLDDEFLAFLLLEYSGMLLNLSKPMTLRELAAKQLPVRKFSELDEAWVAQVDGNVQGPSGIVFPGDVMKGYVNTVEEEKDT